MPLWQEKSLGHVNSEVLKVKSPDIYISRQATGKAVQEMVKSQELICHYRTSLLVQ